MMPEFKRGAPTSWRLSGIKPTPSLRAWTQEWKYSSLPLLHHNKITNLSSKKTDPSWTWRLIAHVRPLHREKYAGVSGKYVALLHGLDPGNKSPIYSCQSTAKMQISLRRAPTPWSQNPQGKSYATHRYIIAAKSQSSSRRTPNSYILWLMHTHKLNIAAALSCNIESHINI